MSIFSSSSRNLTFSFKVGLVSTCLLTVAIVLKYSLPSVSEFVASDVPVAWKVLLQWLKPPYLYLIINCIILSIVASSKLRLENNKPVLSGDVYDHHVAYHDDVEEKVVLSGDDVQSNGGYGAVYEDVSEKEEDKKKKNVGYSDITVDSGGDVDGVTPVRSDSTEVLEKWFEKEKVKEREKPSVSSRFGQRKAIKTSPEGTKALRVSRPKRDDTLESTWKTITEGRAMPLNRHLKKSDTWDTHVRHNTPPPASTMKKSETFHESTSANDANNGSDTNSGRLRREPSLRLRKEPSLSQDDLNRRVEAFIKKFNEEMRLQRQRSIDQYNEMIRLGAN